MFAYISEHLNINSHIYTNMIKRKSRTITEEVRKVLPSLEEYLRKLPNKTALHYWELPQNLIVELKDNQNIKSKNRISIKRLLQNFEKNSEIERGITSIMNWRFQKYKLNINLPLNFENKYYVALYSHVI